MLLLLVLAVVLFLLDHNECEKMQRIKCIIAYDGTQFSGYQVQPNKRTVQQ